MSTSSTSATSPKSEQSQKSGDASNDKKGIRPSSTVILIRPKSKNAKLEPGESNFEFLMIQRSKKSGFFPGAYAFPGGVLEPVDFDPRWTGMISTSRGSQSNTHPPYLIKNEGKELDEFAFRIGAIREMFEEVNVLLASTASTTSHHLKDLQVKLKEFRSKVQDDANEFLEMCLMLGVVPKTDSLLPFSHWITPIQESRRYTTLFYVGVIPNESSDNATTLSDSTSSKSKENIICNPLLVPEFDQKETVSMCWFSPQSALKSFAHHSIFLPPPTWITIQQLAAFSNIDELLKEFHNVKTNVPSLSFNEKIVRSPSKAFETNFGAFHLKPVMPTILVNDGTKVPKEVLDEVERKHSLEAKNKVLVSLIILPGDPLHHDTQSIGLMMAGRRHRLVVIGDKDNKAPETWQYILESSAQTLTSKM